MNKENKETLVNKLQGALQNLRRERDQVHRRKELSLERARLAKEEEQNLSRVFNGMQQRLDQLTKSSMKIKEELGPMEKELGFKTKEVSQVLYLCVSAMYYGRNNNSLSRSPAKR
jgi:hypothetical protein